MRSLMALAAAAALVPLHAFAQAVAPPASSPAAAVAARPLPRPLVPQLDAAGVTKLCDDGLAKARKSLAEMEARGRWGSLFDEWNKLQIAMEDVTGPVYLLSNVHPDKSVREAAEPCLRKFTTLSTEIYQSEKLFARLNAAEARSAHQEKLKKDMIEGFEDTGVSLAPDKRKRAKEIFDKLEELSQDFERNVREDPTKVTFTPKEMEGLPESYLKDRKRDAKGNYVLGLDYPSYFPFLQNAKDEAARKRYYVAKTSEGGKPNLDRLYEMFKLRQELAGLYGLPSYAHYALRRRMVETPETVFKFLAEVKAAVVDLEAMEIEELRGEKAKDTGKPLADTRLNRWDLSYYQEKVRRSRYSIDQEKLRKYFPTDKAIDYTFAVSQRLLGVKFREVKVPAWHPDVRYFEVLDARNERLLGGFYLDLFPREGKYEHAGAFSIRGTSLRAARLPLSALVTNFNREGLNHEELETLLHEFGHVLHGVISRTEYNPQAGTSVKRDFVEAPSQMFEEWARREQPLALLTQVCPQCPHLSHDDIERLESARLYGKGIFYARQALYASYDMALSTDPQPPLALWTKMEEATPLGHVEGTMFPAGFSHLSSGYPAGYYGYLWSEAIARDLLSKFKDNMLDPTVGLRYRRAILEQGSQDEEMAMVRNFLDRDPTTDAFFAEIKAKR